MMIFSKLESQKADALGLIETWSAARLAYRPLPGAWSAVEVFDHLVRVETGILASAKRGLQTPHRIGIRDRVGFFFIRHVFQSERRVKVPASASEALPQPNVDLAAVVQRWEISRKDLAQMLTQLTPGQLRGGVFRHPVSGWMNVEQILGFFSVHIHHHRFQLTRLGTASEGL